MPAPDVCVAEAPPVAVPSSEDDSWGVLTEIAAPETEADAAALVDVPGGAEAAAGELSDEEQGELARLLRVATAQAGSRTEG